MNTAEAQLKRFILDSGLVSTRDMADAEEKAITKKIGLGAVLVNQGVIGEDDLRRIQARASGILFVDLKSQHIDLDTMRFIPEPVARKHNIVAFKKSPEGIEVAMLDLSDLSAIDFIQKKSGTKILSRLTDTDSIKSALLKYQKGLKADFGELLKRDGSALHTVDTLLKHALVQNASDIHVEPQEKDLLVRYRINGILHDAMLLPKGTGFPITARIKGLAGLTVDENRFPQHGRFRAELSGEKLSFRVSVVPTVYGEKTVIALLRDNPLGFTLEQLGFHGTGLDHLHDALQPARGMILVAGPKGAGKFATLYALLDILNTPNVNISTIENPVKSQIPRINQVAVRADIGFSFTQGLRSLIQQDSDIIMVGELAEAETASLATNAALTGHSILSTLPSKSASLAIANLLDMKIEPLLLASTLSVVVGQRLARKLVRGTERKPLARAELGALAKVVDLDHMLNLLRAEKVIGIKDGWGQVLFGAPKVSSTNDGYDGFIGLQEVLRISPTIKNLIIKGSSRAEIEARAKKEGMMTLLEDGVFKAAQGLTTIEEVLRVVVA